MRDTAWQAESRQWASDALQQRLPAFEHVRTEAWSTVWRCPGRGSPYWFKENIASLTPEGAVHAVLADLAPQHVTAPLAWNVERGWVLTADGGQILTDLYPDRRGMDTAAIRSMLADYASLQLATSGHGELLMSAGLPDRSPATATGTLVQVATEMAAVPTGDPRHITEEELARLQASIDGIDAAARLLGHGPVPLAFEHNDLFPRNVFVPRGGDGYRFFDFGESLWAHPFESLVMLVWEVVHQQKMDVGDSGLLDLDHPAIHDIFDPYLSSWCEFADLPTLRRLTAAALQLAPLYRAERWMHILARVPAALVERHGGTPRAWIFDVERPLHL